MATTELTDILENPELSPDELKSKLEQLKASATKLYSLKNYNAAAEVYSEAAEVQDEINGEMKPENADLLYQYGRCLYHVAVSNSDVLGGKVANSEEPKRKKRKVAGESSKAETSDSAGLIGSALHNDAAPTNQVSTSSKDPIASKPFFQITGDENWTDSEDDGEENEVESQAEEEDDDFAIAYEILDVARVLLIKKIEAVASTTSQEPTENPELRQIKERLADTHDLQAEISLENERFKDAINDTRDSLELKLELYPQESSLIAEAHFKLSLALEFASVTSTAEDADGEEKVSQVDEGLRKEAASEMEKAIASCKLRIAKEEAELATTEAAKVAERKKAVAEVKEMVAEMEQRLVDLKGPGVSLSAVGGTGDALNGGDPLRGILGAMLGESKAEQQKLIADATATANDLTGLIKHKKKPKPEADVSAASYEGKGKRKIDDAMDERSTTSNKKPKAEGE